MAVLTVGTNQQFSTLGAAIGASHDGDTIYVQAGTYTNDFSDINTKISIVGVGGLAHFVAAQEPSNGKGILVTNTDVSIDHLEFSGVAVSDGNGAGIRYQGGALTITNSYFHDNQDGILGNSAAGGTVVIDHSEFGHNGAGDGYTHNLYINNIASLQISNSYIHDAVVGHEIKSRAIVTTLTNNRIDDGNGTASYSVDLPNGGNATLQNNFIQQGPNTQNPSIVAYSEESAPMAGSQLTVSGNTIMNQAGSVLGVWNPSVTITAQITGNHFYGIPASQIAGGPNVQSGNDTLASAPTIDTSHPFAASPWDDMIWAGGANNLLNGTAGHDLFVGGSGNDTFAIHSGGSSDTIAAFDGAHDVVQLNGYGFSTFSAVSAAMTQQGADVLLNLGNGETLTFQNMQKSAFTADDFVFNTTHAHVTYDFNGDGHSDLLLQNNSGQAGVWLMNGGSPIGALAPISPNPGVSAHVKASGDFNGDGKADILLQNDSGQASVWLMDGANPLSTTNVGSNPGSAWHVKDTGDFNGDGKSDILWQNNSGQAAIWLMNGTTRISGTSLAGDNPGKAWHVIGAGDFNGDGKSDILWQNDSGQAAIWLMNGGTDVSHISVGSNPGTTWHVKGAADFNGDGKDDILWQNDSGQMRLWLMNGGTVVSKGSVGTADPAWHIKGAEDFNGDGKADIVTQSNDGHASVWLMNGTSVLEHDVLATNPGTAWHVDWA
ncbi:MAG TPA: FG-GAP-like repeat-containing protein [Micropepsaceae bacterium]|nr:FG-GAP-like repeat-containing protein [Micropepsaceae bacterium]